MRFLFKGKILFLIVTPFRVWGSYNYCSLCHTAFYVFLFSFFLTSFLIRPSDQSFSRNCPHVTNFKHDLNIFHLIYVPHLEFCLLRFLDYESWIRISAIKVWELNTQRWTVHQREIQACIYKLLFFFLRWTIFKHKTKHYSASCKKFLSKDLSNILLLWLHILFIFTHFLWVHSFHEKERACASCFVSWEI